MARCRTAPRSPEARTTTATTSRSRSSSSSTPEVTLTDKQWAFCESESPALLYRGGVASGKTYAGVIRSIVRRYAYPGTIQLIAGPSWDQLRDGTMRTLRRLLNPACIVYENKVDHIWRLDNGSEFIFRTLAEPDVLRGVELHDAYLDENAMMSPEALDITMGRLRLPYADPAFKHSVWGTTTPRGNDYTLDVWGKEGKPGYEVIHSTIYDNRPNLPDGYIERLEEKYRDTPFFAQELLGEYTAFEGLVYSMFDRRTHQTGAPCDLTDCKRVAVGVDWGGIMPSAMVLWGQRASGGIHQYAEFYRTGAELGEMMARLDEWCERARLRRGELRVACDGSEPVAIATLAAAGFDAFAANKDRGSGIKYVQGLLQVRAGGPTLTIDHDCPFTAREYGEYIWAERRDVSTKVMYRTDTPVDHHADLMDASRYCAMCIGQAEPEPERVRLPSGLMVYR